jgi:transposase
MRSPACPVLATALVASIADPKAFRSGRNFSAWIGLVPKQHSSGGRDRLGSISKQGDRYLRSLFMRARRDCVFRHVCFGPLAADVGV